MGSVKVMIFWVVSRWYLVRFEGATAIFIKITVSWDITPCVLLVVRTKLKTETATPKLYDI